MAEPRDEVKIFAAVVIFVIALLALLLGKSNDEDSNDSDRT